MTTIKVTKPRSEGQQAHCKGFGLIAKLSSDLKMAHEIGLRKESLRRKTGKRRPTTFSCFKHLNKNCFNADGVDYPHVVVSKGPLAKPDIASVRMDGNGSLTLTFSNRCYDGDPDDELILAAYCPRLRACLLTEPVPRRAEALTAQLPARWLVGGSDIHLYAFFLGKKLFASDSIYIPLPNIRPGQTAAIPAPTTAVTPDPITSPLTPFDPINPIIDPTNPTIDPINPTVDPINLDPITAKLFRVIQEDGTLTYAGYAKQLGISEATVKRRLQSLKAQGLIFRCGSNKTGHWELP